MSFIFFDAYENLKPDRTELQQLEESLENHFKLISGISQDLVELRHVVQQSNDGSGKLYVMSVNFVTPNTVTCSGVTT